MRAFFILAILLSAFLFGNAQELKTKKIQSQTFTEIFQVNKKSKQKHGTYLKIQTSYKDTVSKGQFMNDTISGVWTYFDNKNKPYMKYDHSNDSCLWISELINKPDTFPVRIRNNFGFTLLDRPPLYIGFFKEPEFAFAQTIKVPVEMMKKGESLLCMASFVVNKAGKVVDINTDKIENSQIRSMVENIFQSNEWNYLPGILEGNPVDTKLYVIFDFGPEDQVQETPRKPYVKYIKIRYFGFTYTKVVKTTTRSVSSGGSDFGRTLQNSSKIH